MTDNVADFETRAIHAGVEADPTTGARQTPIYQTTSFVFKNAKHAADLFTLGDAGHVYSRLTNPTVEALEKRMAALEGGVGATAAASGISGHLLAFFSLLVSSDNFALAPLLILDNILPSLGTLEITPAIFPLIIKTLLSPFETPGKNF